MEDDILNFSPTVVGHPVAKTSALIYLDFYYCKDLVYLLTTRWILVHNELDGLNKYLQSSILETILYKIIFSNQGTGS